MKILRLVGLTAFRLVIAAGALVAAINILASPGRRYYRRWRDW